MSAKTFVFAVMTGFCATGWGAQLVKWDFSSLTNGSGYGPSPMAETVKDAGVTVVGLTRDDGVGTNGAGTTKGWGGNSFTAASEEDAIASNDVATFAIAAASGYTVSLTNIAPYNIRRSSTGPTSGIWQFQVDAGPFTDLGSAITWGSGTSSSGNDQPALSLADVAALQNLPAGRVVTFRIAAWGGTSSGGTWYLNDQSGTRDLIVNGTVTAFASGPAVSIASPPNNARFVLGTPIHINATATDSGTVTNVAFFADGGRLGNDGTAPYGWTWTGAAAGSHKLTAVAWNGDGVCATSDVANVMVVAMGLFSRGNVVVYRVGDGATNLVNTGAPVFLDEYTTNGALVQSVAMPTNAAGGNYPLIASGTATSEGLLTRSPDGRYLALTGYGTNMGLVSLSGTAATTVPRVVGLVKCDGEVDLTTALGDYASASSPRSALTTDGTNIWVTGGAGGLRYATKGGATSLQLNPALTNLRQVNCFGNQLYVSSQSGANRINTVGNGMPTESGQTILSLANVPTNGNPNAFLMVDLTNDGTNDTLYVADEGVGIEKFSLEEGTWMPAGVVPSSAGAYCGLTGYVAGSNVVLFATSATELDRVTDSSGYAGTLSGTPTPLATAAGKTAFRGVAPAPIPPSPPKGTVLSIF